MMNLYNVITHLIGICFGVGLIKLDLWVRSELFKPDFSPEAQASLFRMQAEQAQKDFQQSNQLLLELKELLRVERLL